MARATGALPPSDSLFKEGWTRSRGRAGGGRIKGTSLRAQRHMARAAAGNRAAVVKLIARGGCRTTQQLHGQLGYLLGKADAVLDSRGLYERDGPLSSEDALAAAERWSQDWQGKTRTGHTSHMVMSFPCGTDAATVRAISERFCERFFDGRYDYIAAVHTDRAHPHTHIVVNRRGFEGDLFTLRVGTDYSYASFKDAMVEIGAEHGVAMEASHRLERGITERAPTVAEYRAGQTEGIPRDGDDLAWAVQQVAKHSATYKALAAQARALVRSDLAQITRGQADRPVDLSGLADALDRAAETLSAGKSISTATGTVPMDQQTRFHEALRRLDVATQQAAERIEAAAPADRPAMEAKLNAVLAQASTMNPHGRRAAELAQPASEEGIYARHNAAHVAPGEGDARLERALEGTGLDPDEVAARMRVGATNAALERQWIADDVRAVAMQRGLDLKDQQQFEAALTEVDRIHDRVADDLGIGVEGTIAGESTSTAKAQAQNDRVQEAVEAQEAAARVETRSHATAKADLARMAAPASEADAERYRAAVEERLTPAEVAKLRRGDVTVLEGVGSREDQLSVAREYLKADGHSPEALRQVTRELHQAREIAHSQRGHDDGIDHA